MKASRLRAILFGLFCIFISGCEDTGIVDLRTHYGPPLANQSDRIRAAADYSRDMDHAALLIYFNNALVHEEYAANGDTHNGHGIFSGTKSFSCAMAVAAQTDGLITNLDEFASTTLTEWASDSVKSRITLRQLLNLTSGIYQDNAGFLLYSGNKNAYAVSLPAIAAPGTTFQYGEVHIAIFAEIMRRKLAATTRESPLRYLRRKVFDQIGLNYESWVTDSVGNPMMSFGAILKATEWAKYGILLKNNGSWNGVQVLNAALLSECFQGSSAMTGYGLSMWLNTYSGSGFTNVVLMAGARSTFNLEGAGRLLYDNGPSDLVAIAGFGDNRIYFSNSQNFVVVRQGRGGLLSDWKDERFLALLLDGIYL